MNQKDEFIDWFLDAAQTKIYCPLEDTTVNGNLLKVLRHSRETVSKKVLFCNVLWSRLLKTQNITDLWTLDSKCLTLLNCYFKSIFITFIGSALKMFQSFRPNFSVAADTTLSNISNIVSRIHAHTYTYKKRRKRKVKKTHQRLSDKHNVQHKLLHKILLTLNNNLHARLRALIYQGNLILS